MPTLGLVLLLISGDARQVYAKSISLEKIQELYVRGFYYPTGTIYQGITTWTETPIGYVLRTPARLYFYSRSLDLIRSVRMGEDDPYGAVCATLVAESLLYVLQAQRISIFDIQGKISRELLYPPDMMRGTSLAVLGNRIGVAGHYYSISTDKPVPRLCIYDTALEREPFFYDDFYPDSTLSHLSRLKNKIIPSVMCAKSGDYIALVSTFGPEIFLFTPDGKVQAVIVETSSSYKGAFETHPDSMWDYVNPYYGIAVLDDSLLAVPRKTRFMPYYLDIYNLKARKFVERIECNTPIIGASSGKLFFADSLTEDYARISVYKIISAGSVNSTPDSFKDVSVCKKCGQPIGKYEYVKSSDNIKTIDAGRQRTALVLPFSSFDPDSLRNFCSKTKKNMFVFAAPDVMGGVLIDTISRSIRGRQDWHLITVVCSSEPEKLGLYVSGLYGDILINKNAAIPDSTMALSDMGLPPMAIAFSKGGKEFIAGYSLTPNYDKEKKEYSGLTYAEFLQRCGITE